jgi:hypothetical protein
MKQSSNSRRSRGRGIGKRQPKNSNFDSNGPEVRVRGSAQQVYEKYLTLARDAMAVDDRISSENYFQHAEHYFRILGAQESGDGRDGGRNRRGRNQPHQENQSEEDDSPTNQESTDQNTPQNVQESVMESPPPAPEQPAVTDLAGSEQPSVEMPPETEPPAPEQPEAASDTAATAPPSDTAEGSDSETETPADDGDGPRDSAVA